MKELKGSKTEQNLKTALEGEALAHMNMNIMHHRQKKTDMLKSKIFS